MQRTSRKRQRKVKESRPGRDVNEQNQPSVSEPKRNDLPEKSRKRDKTVKKVHYTQTNGSARTSLSAFITPWKEREMVAEPGIIEYTKADEQGRREILKNSAVIVRRHMDLNQFRRAFVNVREKNKHDPVLEKLNLDLLPNDVRCTVYRILGVRVSDGQPEESKRDITLGEKFDAPEWLKTYVETQQYHPPKTRILITKNLTLNKNDVIPVYSDVKDETLENLNVNNTLTYTYGELNRINRNLEIELSRAVEEAKEEQNLIRCHCHDSGEPLIPCYENEACPCYKTNKAMQVLQVSALSNAPRTEFSTLKPILCNTAFNPFYEFVGFACSELCSCKGKCTNNSLYLLEKRHIPLELYRVDPIIGFGMRSPVLIPAGTPFLEFVGEITDSKHVTNQDDSSEDYAYRITYDTDQRWQRFVLNHKKWTSSYKELLTNLNKQAFHCNPKHYGNVGRTALHSCIANVEILRVYQKSLSPAHVRLVMISLEDIYPGIPITLDYGKLYVQKQLNGICKCGTFACHNGNHYQEFSRLNSDMISGCLSYLNTEQAKLYNKLIIQQATAFVKKEEMKKRQESTNNQVIDTTKE